MIGERPNKKNIESFNLKRKVNLLRLWRGKECFAFNTRKIIIFLPSFNQTWSQNFIVTKVKFDSKSNIWS